MFWRYLNTQGGQIDVLLARDPPPSLEELLDDDELLSELKGQSNTRLIDFLSRPEAIRGLMGWVTKGLESPEKRGRETEEDKKRATRFPALATEVLCSELWTIVETSLSPSHDLMRPFWEAVLSPVPTKDEVPLVPPGDTSSSSPSSPSSAVMDVDLVDVLVDASTLSPIAAAVSSTDNAPSSELAETDSPAAAAAPKSITEQTLEDELAADAGNGTELVHGLWARVNSVFLTKKTADMLSFIRSQPFVLERILRKIHSPAIVDLLFRIIQCEDAPSGQGVIDWLSSESLIPRLTSFLAPSHYPHHHETATDLLKGIITMSAPAPGPFNPNLGSPGGPDSSAPGGLGPMRNNKFARELVAEDTVERLVGYMLDEPLRTSDQTAANGDVASMAPSTSSLTSSIAVFIELIRKNNSDYSEPHLFHTLRQGLMQHSSSRPPLTECEAAETVTNGEDRESNDQKDMEDAMESLNQGMGIVHLGSMLTVLSARLGSFQELIERPRSDVQPVPTTAGAAAPLTLERFRIIELYAELLHCSNMAILNRPNGTGPSYDDDGRLVGGLSGLDDLSVALSASESDVDDRAADEVFQEAKELPVSTSSAASSDVGNMEGVVAESQTTSSVPDVLSSAPAPAEKEDIAATAATAAPVSGAKTPETSEPVISELVAAATPADTTASDVASVSQHAVLSTTAVSSSSNKALTSAGSSGGLSPGDTLKQTFIDRGLLLPLFDLLIEHPLNNFLHNVIYDIFQQILSGRLNPGLNRDLVVVLFNDASLIDKVLHGQKLNDAMPVRLGFMGHLILIAEEILKFFERCPADLFAIIAPSYHASEWAAFVEGPYQAAKAKDNTIMGGGRPGPPLGSGMGMDGSGVDLESDSDDDDDNSPGMSAFSRNFGGGLSSEDGGSGNATEVFSRYLAQQMTSGASDRQFESSSSDDDDDDEGWINDSQSFNRPVSEDAFSSMRREGSHHARDDSFGASSSSAFDDDDDDAWGSFQSTPSRSTGDNADADPFGDDFAAPSGPQSANSEALAALEWNDASFAQNFVDGDSGDEDDASTPTGSAPAGWGSFQPTSSDVSSTISAIPIPQSTSPIRLAARTTALSLSSPSSSPTERLQLPPGASSIFTPMSAISPPDSSLLEATSVERPLGPGVDPKTTTEHHGLLEKKTAEGKTIVVPKDEIVLAIEAEAEKHP